MRTCVYCKKIATQVFSCSHTTLLTCDACIENAYSDLGTQADRSDLNKKSIWKKFILFFR
jgi:hypothetical protein